MAASAGTMVFVGQQSRRVYVVDVYIPDATGTSLTFNTNGLAGTGSQTSYRAPESMVLVDVTTAAAPTAVGFSLTVNGAIVQGGAIRWANQLNTLSKRLTLAIPITKGDFIGGLQF